MKVEALNPGSDDDNNADETDQDSSPSSPPNFLTQKQCCPHGYREGEGLHDRAGIPQRGVKQTIEKEQSRA